MPRSRWLCPKCGHKHFDFEECIFDSPPVEWEISVSSGECFHRSASWCKLMRERCEIDTCPLKVKVK